MAICLLERWSRKGPDRVIGDALFGTDILSSQYRLGEGESRFGRVDLQDEVPYLDIRMRRKSARNVFAGGSLNYPLCQMAVPVVAPMIVS
jgi:hypothetical protein